MIQDKLAPKDQPTHIFQKVEQDGCGHKEQGHGHVGQGQQQQDHASAAGDKKANKKQANLDAVRKHNQEIVQQNQAQEELYQRKILAMERLF